MQLKADTADRLPTPGHMVRGIFMRRKFRPMKEKTLAKLAQE